MAFQTLMDVDVDVDDEDIPPTWNDRFMQGRLTEADPPCRLTEADDIENQLIEEAKRASLAEARQQENHEQSALAIVQDRPSKKIVRFNPHSQHMSPSMDTGFLRIHEDHLFTTGESETDSTPSHSETDESIEADSTSDTNTEERLSPIDKRNINGAKSDRPITSLPFVEWPDKIRQEILMYILFKEDEPIRPYYHEGSVEGDSEETKRPNYDITMLLATAAEPQLYQETLKIFYGQNVWEFRNPRVAQWWLKKIGTKVALLRHVDIYLTQGIWGPGSTPLEKLWYMLIVWMKPRVELYTFNISFQKWDHGNVRSHDKPPTDVFPVAESRLGVWSTLLSYRELNETDITPGPFVPYEYAAALARTMVLKEGQVDGEAERLRRKWRRKVYPDI